MAGHLLVVSADTVSLWQVSGSLPSTKCHFQSALAITPHLLLARAVLPKVFEDTRLAHSYRTKM